MQDTIQTKRTDPFRRSLFFFSIFTVVVIFPLSLHSLPKEVYARSLYSHLLLVSTRLNGLIVYGYDISYITFIFVFASEKQYPESIMI